MTKQEMCEKEETAKSLRAVLEPGTTVYTVLRHCSRSGMYRAIDLYLLQDGDRTWLSPRASLVTGIRFDKRHEAIGVGGCGMDAGFHLVYTLSSALYPDGFDCVGDKCPSNDHANVRGGNCAVCGAIILRPPLYKRGYHGVCSRACAAGQWRHKDGGYALRHKWL